MHLSDRGSVLITTIELTQASVVRPYLKRLASRSTLPILKLLILPLMAEHEALGRFRLGAQSNGTDNFISEGLEAHNATAVLMLSYRGERSII